MSISARGSLGLLWVLADELEHVVPQANETNESKETHYEHQY